MNLIKKLFAALQPAAPVDDRLPLPAGPITSIRVKGVDLLGPETALKRFTGTTTDGEDLLLPALGLGFGTRDGRVDSFRLIWHDPYLAPEDAQRLRPFAAAFEIAGRTIRFTATTTEDDVVAALGQPYWRDVDDDEILLFYEYSGAELQIELSPDGQIRILLATTPPLMADERQRVSYRVTAPWPPPLPEGVAP